MCFSYAEISEILRQCAHISVNLELMTKRVEITQLKFIVMKSIMRSNKSCFLRTFLLLSR